MPIMDSKSSRIKYSYKLEDIEKKAEMIRFYTAAALCASESEYCESAFSIIDIAAVLYLNYLRHDPVNPGWINRDRVFWSAGHKAPAIYSTLGICGYFPVSEVLKYRKLFSGYDRYPDRFRTLGIEVSGGSPGHGLGIAVGDALRARNDGYDYEVFCIMSGGEQFHGSVWEAAMSASCYRLNNLVAIIDRNDPGPGCSGKKELSVSSLADKYASFGWQVFLVNGHDLNQILQVLEVDRSQEQRPSVIISDYSSNDMHVNSKTIYSLSDLYRVFDITGKKTGTVLCPLAPDELLHIAEKHDAVTENNLKERIPSFSRDYSWNSEKMMRVSYSSSAEIFLNYIAISKNRNDMVFMGEEILKAGSENILQNDSARRYIPEQNMTLMAAGFAKEGKIPFIISYGAFITGKNWEQIRSTVCFNNFNVKIVDAYGGFSSGREGAVHHSLEDLSALYYLPNIHIFLPADSFEMIELLKSMTELQGPAVIRFSCESLPVVTNQQTPFRFGKANVIRYRSIRCSFTDAFEIFSGEDYISENEDLCILTFGVTVSESMRAAYILKEEFDIETRVLNINTLKPLDIRTILRSAEETGAVLTVEEHQTGGFGNIIAGAVMKNADFSFPVSMDMLGVEDRFSEGGKSSELRKLFGLTAENIAEKALGLLNRKIKNSRSSANFEYFIKRSI